MNGLYPIGPRRTQRSGAVHTDALVTDIVRLTHIIEQYESLVDHLLHDAFIVTLDEIHAQGIKAALNDLRDRIVADRRREGYSLTEIVAQLHLPKHTIWRRLRAVEQLRRDEREAERKAG